MHAPKAPGQHDSRGRQPPHQVAQVGTSCECPWRMTWTRKGAPKSTGERHVYNQSRKTKLPATSPLKHALDPCPHVLMTCSQLGHPAVTGSRTHWLPQLGGIVWLVFNLQPLAVPAAQNHARHPRTQGQATGTPFGGINRQSGFRLFLQPRICHVVWPAWCIMQAVPPYSTSTDFCTVACCYQHSVVQLHTYLGGHDPGTAHELYESGADIAAPLPRTTGICSIPV